MSHYDTLGVANTATPDEIKKAYRKLASQHHPDKGGDTAKFQQIEEAYRILSDTNQRAQYDSQLRGNPGGFRFTVNGQDINGFPPEMGDIFNKFGFNFGGHDPFAQFRQQQPKRNKDMRVELRVDLEDTLNQNKKVISVQTTNGERQTIEVDIPRGIHNGSQIKYPGLGDNFFTSIPRGDLYIHFTINPHPKFQISGYDLFTNIDINALDAIIGCSVEFLTLDGKTFELTVPPGTQFGTKFKIGGQGLYAMNQSARGNLYLIANIVIPTDLSEDKLETIRQLRNTK